MKNGIHKIHLFKEKEKMRQVTHWDLDYLTRDEIKGLYERSPELDQQRDEKRDATGKSNRYFSLLLITMGILLLARALLVAALI